MQNSIPYTIAEFFTLPSEGKVYSEMVDPKVQLRSMTTAEEMRRLSPTEHPYENLCSIIDDCMVEGPPMSSYDMCLGDYQFLLYKLRIVTYGADYLVSSNCPYCKSNSQETIDLDSLTINTYNEDIDDLFNVELPVTKHKIRLKMTTPKMLDTLKDRITDYKRKATDKTVDASILFNLSMVIDTVDGRKVPAPQLEEMLRKLPMKDTNYLAVYSDKLNSVIGIDTSTTFVCDICGLSHRGKLSITSEFFRPSLDI